MKLTVLFGSRTSGFDDVLRAGKICYRIHSLAQTGVKEFDLLLIIIFSRVVYEYLLLS